MSGLISHQATHEELQHRLKKQKVMKPFWSVGSKLDNIHADLHGPSHGFNFSELKGDIIELTIKKTLQLVDRLLDGKNYTNPIRDIIHYCEDSCTIGQISGPKYWGQVDNKIDLASEFVNGKKDHPWQPTIRKNTELILSPEDNGNGEEESERKESTKPFKVIMENKHGIIRDYKRIKPDELTIAELHLKRIAQTYKYFNKDVRRWGWFVSPSDVTKMTQWAVSVGASLAGEYIYFAYKMAGKPKVRKFFPRRRGLKLNRNRRFKHLKTYPNYSQRK